jgi:hypothetical protein
MPIDPFTSGMLKSAGQKLVEYLFSQQTCEVCKRLVLDTYRTGCCEKILCGSCRTRWLEDPTRCEYCNKRFGPTQRRTPMIGASNNQGDPRVRSALEQLECPHEVDADGDFKIIVKLAEGRTQVVLINSNTESFAGIEIREVYSLGYIEDRVPDERLLKSLLLENGTVKFGAWRLIESGNGQVGVVFAAHIAASTDAKTLDSIIDFVAAKADEFEDKLYGTDKY